MVICLSRQVTSRSLRCCCPRKSNYFHSSSPRIAAFPPRKRRKSAPFHVGNDCESSLGLESPPVGFRKNVGICLINPEKKRLDSRHDAWQMPQGGMGDDEDPRVAAMRELREETGVVCGGCSREVPFCLTYDFPPDVRERLAILRGKEWKGQAQRWVMGAEKTELREWAWMKPDDLIEQSVEFVQPVYKQVFSAFAPHFQ